MSRFLTSACIALLALLVANAVQAAVITIEGTVKSVDAKKRTISVKTKTKTLDLDVSRKAKVSVKGKTAKLDSLKVGQAVKLDYHDGLEIVLKIDVSPVGVLFDGSTLNGWDFNSKYWKIADRTLVGTCPAKLGRGGAFIATKVKYKDFSVTFKYRVKHGNSGFFLRCQTDTGSFQKYNGIQADIGPGITGIGSCFHGPVGSPTVASPARIQLLKVERSWEKDGWNDYTVTCIGDDISCDVNGVKIMSWKDRQKPRQGHIAIHLHGVQATTILIKNITISQL